MGLPVLFETAQNADAGAGDAADQCADGEGRDHTDDR